MTFFFTKSYSQNNEIIVDISEQRLYLYNNDNLVQSFPVSTSKYGEGQIENSKTHWDCMKLKKKLEIKRQLIQYLLQEKTQTKEQKFKSILMIQRMTL